MSSTGSGQTWDDVYDQLLAQWGDGFSIWDDKILDDKRTTPYQESLIRLLRQQEMGWLRKSL